MRFIGFECPADVLYSDSFVSQFDTLNSHRISHVPKFAANLTMLFNELPFLDRFAASASAGFDGVEYLFPYAFPARVLAERLRASGGRTGTERNTRIRPRIQPIRSFRTSPEPICLAEDARRRNKCLPRNPAGKNPALQDGKPR